MTLVQIPQPDNMSNVLIDGRMWHAQPQDDQPGWADAGGSWVDTDAFAVILDAGRQVTFYSPTGRVIDA